jgi:hypothetical protein
MFWSFIETNIALFKFSISRYAEQKYFWIVISFPNNFQKLDSVQHAFYTVFFLVSVFKVWDWSQGCSMSIVGVLWLLSSERMLFSA